MAVGAEDACGALRLPISLVCGHTHFNTTRRACAAPPSRLNGRCRTPFPCGRFRDRRRDGAAMRLDDGRATRTALCAGALPASGTFAVCCGVVDCWPRLFTLYTLCRSAARAYGGQNTRSRRGWFKQLTAFSPPVLYPPYSGKDERTTGLCAWIKRNACACSGITRAGLLLNIYVVQHSRACVQAFTLQNAAAPALPSLLLTYGRHCQRAGLAAYRLLRANGGDAVWWRRFAERCLHMTRACNFCCHSAARAARRRADVCLRQRARAYAAARFHVFTLWHAGRACGTRAFLSSFQSVVYGVRVRTA